MCAVRVYWQNKDFAMESWHNVLERPSWRSCAPPAFLLLPRSRKFNSQFSRPDMDAPQVECLETRKHTEHKTKSTSCGIAHCVCVYTQCCQRLGMSRTLKIQPNASCHCAHADVQPPEQELKVGESTTKDSWRWKILRSLCTQKPSKTTLSKTLLDQLLQVTWPNRVEGPTPLRKVTRNRRPLSTTLPWLTGFRMCHVSAVIRCAWRCQRNYKIFTL